MEVSWKSEEVLLIVNFTSAAIRSNVIALKNIYKMYYFSKGTISQSNIADYSETPCTIGEENYTHYIAPPVTSAFPGF